MSNPGFHCLFIRMMGKLVDNPQFFYAGSIP
jgi:hypothetical protein